MLKKSRKTSKMLLKIIQDQKAQNLGHLKNQSFEEMSWFLLTHLLLKAGIGKEKTKKL